MRALKKSCVFLLLAFCIMNSLSFTTEAGITTKTSQDWRKTKGIEGLNFRKANGIYYMYDEVRQIRVFDLKGTNVFDIKNYNALTPISSNDIQKWPKDALSVYRNMARVYDFYKNVLGVKGLDGNNKTLNVFINHDKGDNGAFAFSDNGIAFYPNPKNRHPIECVEDATQEYTHLVVANTAHLSSDLLSVSMNEGYAITMGLLVDNYLSPRSKADEWNYNYHENYQGKQNFKDPLESNNAKEVGGKNYYDDINFVRPEGWGFNAAAYRTAGVFEHAVYQMSINGISTKEKLAMLLYRSLVALSSPKGYMTTVHNYSWENIRWSFETAAEKLKFSNAEKNAVKKSFDIVKVTTAQKPGSFGYRFNKDGTVEITGSTNMTTQKVVIPSKINNKTVTKINYSAFLNCTELQEIIIPDSVESIGGQAFYGCINLTSVKLPSKLKKIEQRTFGDCRVLKNINIPETVTEIGEIAFGGCLSLKDVKLPKKLLSIGWYGFGNCKSLTSITLPDGIKIIRTRTFQDCTELRNVYIPKNVMNIEENAFHYTAGNKSIVLPNINITGVKGSYAEKYAQKNGIRFIAAK